MGVSYAQQMLTASHVRVCSREGIERRFVAPRSRAVVWVAGGRAMVQGPNRIRLLWGKDEFLPYIRERDGFICTYCGQFGNTVDHVWPRSKGGLNTPANCVCACRTCNGLKGALSVSEFLAVVTEMRCTCYTYINGITRTCLKHRILERAPHFLHLGGNAVQKTPV